MVKLSAAIGDAAEANVPAGYVLALAAEFGELGEAPAREFLATEGLTEKALESVETVPAMVFSRLYRRAMLLLDNEALGLVSHGKVVAGTFRLFCLSLAHTNSLAEMLTRAGEFLDVVRGNAVKPVVQREGSLARISIARVSAPDVPPLNEVLEAAGTLSIRSTLFIWMNLFSWFVGRPLSVQRIEFAFAEPRRGSEWPRLFGAPVQFEAVDNAMLIPIELLDLPNVQNEAAIELFVKSAPLRLLIPGFRDQPVSNRVLRVFGDDLQRPLPHSEEVAERLGMSISTLRRRLRGEGTSLQQLKDDCRRAAAIRYLSVDSLSLAEVASLVGFEDASTFLRAFRRWTGMTPGSYREELLAE